MKRSVAEISAVLAKAARGAGLPLGVAEELALAAPWMTGTELREIAALLDAVDRHGVLLDVCGALDELVCGRDARSVAVSPRVAVALAAGRGLPAQVNDQGALKRAAQCPPPQSGPVELAAEDWTLLDRLAARTYVPSTEASRRAGAGAGLIDND